MFGRRHRRGPKNVDWAKKWSRSYDPFRNGRVLVVDCFSRTHSDSARRKTITQEFTTKHELNKFYSRTAWDKDHNPCLRVIHVQNASWAREMLFKKYGIFTDGKLESAHNAFSRWAKYDKPQRRAGHPVLNARSFALDKNVYRKVWRCGFGTDYLRYFAPGHMHDSMEPNLSDFRLCSLNEWKETDNNSYSAPGPDVYVQRLSVYVQRNMENAGLEDDEWDDSSSDIDQAEERPPSQSELNQCDNTTTVIVFESSHSGLVRDTLIEARNEIERKWRRMFTDLPRHDISTDEELGLYCIDLAVGYIITALTASWEKFVTKCDEHISILEDRIYENPADETKAPELWRNSSLWLKLEKLLSLQASATSVFRSSLRELSGEPDREFLKDADSQLSRIRTLIDEELSKPTVSLTDLVYKSVDIRDSRHSIQLNSSMWRLSWISFVFLPMTTLSAIFGMNVDVFQPQDGNFPAIWWFFVAAVPLLIIVMVAVNFLKAAFDSGMQDPVRRATYEEVYNRFSESRSDLWTRAGPKESVRFTSYIDRMRWAIIKTWLGPKHTIAPPRPNSWSATYEAIGLFGQIKTYISSFWLVRLRPDASGDPLSAAEKNEGLDSEEAVFQYGRAATLAVAEGAPEVALIMNEPFRQELAQKRTGSSGSGSQALVRPGSAGSEQIMVEEEEAELSESKSRERGDNDSRPTSRGRVDIRERAERRGETQSPPNKEKRPTTLLGIPTSSRQILTRSDSAPGATGSSVSK